MVNEEEKMRLGLTDAEVERSRREHGENVLTPPRRRSLWRLYLEKYEDPIIRILLVAALASLALAFFTGDYVETLGIILAVLFATTVGFYFERDAARKFDVLTALDEEQQVKVVRNGHTREVPRREVVVGDLVIVETGDEIPADGKLMSAIDMQVDESSLTGEPMTHKRVLVPPKLGGDRGLNERYSGESINVGSDPQPPNLGGNGTTAAYPEDLLLRSSMVLSGTGRFVVTAVGDETEIGHVAREATEITGLKTPLNLQLERLAKLISKVGSAVATLAFLAFLAHDVLTNSLWHTTNYLAMAEVVLRYFMMAVTLIVMAVPEGLPMAVTLALALNMRRMLRSNILVRKLQASETIGAVTVICTDKTGTLTQNRMEVAELHPYEGAEPDRWLFLGIALNTTAELDEAGQHGIGNPTEAALLRWLQRQGVDYRQLRAEARIVDRVPFSTERKYMATLAEVDGKRLLFLKGAPELVLAHCSMDQEHRNVATNLLRSYQRQAMRTLLLAMTPMPADCETIPQEMPALWLQAEVGISDPVRDDVPHAIEQCREAGIEVKIVTGDNVDTALEIGRQIGLTGESMTGDAFSQLNDDEALAAVRRLRVMSRARPHDKQRLVELLQRQGQVVAVTGDGTNDAPALNHAHVGLSLGSGTSVAKQASDITLLNDSFRSVVSAVEWGRSLYRNIQRFIFFQLVVNVAALLLVLGGSVIGTELPLTVTQILWVNLIMDTFAAMALASLPPSHEVMHFPPRCPGDFILSRGMLWGIGLIGSLFFAVMMTYLYRIESGGINVHELTCFFTTFVMLQWWNLFNARALASRHSAFHHLFWCRGFLFVLALILVGQWAIVEWGGSMFRTEPLSATEWFHIIVLTSPVLWLGELFRCVQRLRRRP